MANRFPLLSCSKQLAKHLHSSVSSISITSGYTMRFSTAYPHPQGSDTENPSINRAEDEGSGVTGNMAEAAKEGTRKAGEVAESVGGAAMDTVGTAWDAAKNAAQNVMETTTAEADTNVIDTAEYRSAEDLKGQLGDGYDKKIEL